MKNFTSQSQKIGELGEGVACIYLQKKGFTVLERNYTKKWGEIDIVAEKAEKLYFIEVKSTSCQLDKINENMFRPEENMHPWKMKRLSRTIETYLIEHRIGNRGWQFDVLLIYLDLFQRKSKVVVIPNIIL